MNWFNGKEAHFKGFVILIIAMIVVAFAVHEINASLIQSLSEKISKNYRQSKEKELRKHMDTAKSAISDYYYPDADEATKSKAMGKLRELRYAGGDGYFFVYELASGRNLVHPVYKEWEGQKKIDLKDCKDPEKYIIKDLIKIATEGGGFDTYRFRKPSANSADNYNSCDDEKPKLGYVVALSDWGLMLGTGVYLDDVNEFTDGLHEEVAFLTTDTILGLLILTSISSLILFMIHTYMGFASGKIEEKLRLIDLLHDSIEQKLNRVISKLGTKRFEIESAKSLAVEDILNFLTEIKACTFVALQEMINIRNNTELNDEITLAEGLREEIRKFTQNEKTPIEFAISEESEAQTNHLLKIKRDKLLSVCRNALSNIAKHAHATQIWIALEANVSTVTLTIRDNGIGFNWDEIKPGIWFKRMDKFKKFGKLDISSIYGQGTTVKAIVPQDQR